jgi:carbon monoxide dehydrogenase subunit G
MPVGPSFDYDRTFDFAVSRDALWDVLNDTDRYPQWWPWLRSFDAAGLTPGTVAMCAVRAPLPYTLEFRVHIVGVEAGRSIDTRVTGDLEGPARLEIGGVDGASTARLTWSVELCLPFLSAASRVARPMLVWAHDRVVSTGVGQFREHALAPLSDRDHD